MAEEPNLRQGPVQDVQHHSTIKGDAQPWSIFGYVLRMSEEHLPKIP